MKRRPGHPAAGSRPGAGPVPAAKPLSPVSLAIVLWSALAIITYLFGQPRDPLSHLVLSVTLAPLLDLTWRGLFAPVPDVIRAGAVLGFEVAAAFGYGATAVVWLNLPWRTRNERAWIALLIGLGLFAFAAYGGGALGFYSAKSYAVLLGAGVLLAVRTRAHGSLPSVPRPAGPWPAWFRWGLGAVALCQFGALVSGFTPCHISDEGIYHLGYPQWYLYAGKATAWPQAFYEFNPKIANMLYGAPLAFGVVFGVKWIHWVGGLLAAAGIAFLLHDAKPAIRRAFVLAFLTIPELWGNAGRAYNDAFILAYAVAAVVAARRAASHPGRGGTGWAWLAGAFVGFAAGLKYNGLFVWMLLWASLGPKRMVAASVGAAVVAGPWFLKTWIGIGNPVFPYFTNVLGGMYWDDHLVWRLTKEQVGGDATVWQRLVVIPGLLWNVPVHGTGGVPGSLLGSIVGLTIAGATGRELAVLAAFYLPIVYKMPNELRYIFPLIPLAFAIAARRLSAAEPGPLVRRWAAAGFVALLWVQAGDYYPAFWGKYDDPLPVILRQKSIHRYLDRRLYPPIYYPPNYSGMTRAVEELTPRNSRILFLGGYGGVFYIGRPALFNTLEGRPLPIPFARESTDPSRLRIKFRQYGITHVIVNRSQNEIFYDFWRMWDWKPGYEVTRWIVFWDRYAVPLWHYADQFELWRLSPRPLVQPHRLTPGIEEEVAKLLGYMIRRRAFSDAEPLLQAMVAIFPQNPTFILRAAEMAARRENLALADLLCDRLARMAPGSVDLERCRAAIFLIRQKYPQAAACLREVTRREAGDAQAWLDLSMVCTMLGQPDAAAWYKRRSDDVKEFRAEHW